MRLWSLHPNYLDSKGLIACWREGLGAQKSLTIGEYTYCEKNHCKIRTPYYNHSQLQRFKSCQYPLRAIGEYLTEIWYESRRRGYKFNANKITYFNCFAVEKLTVTTSQLEYEFRHLQRKLWERDKAKRIENEKVEWKNDDGLLIHNINPHPSFLVINGDIEEWEKAKE